MGNTNNKLIKLKPQEVKNLVFGGGGANGLCYAGALWNLAQTPGCENLENIKRAAGTSIGAVAALAVCLKLTPEQMLEALAKIDFKTVKDFGTPSEIYRRLRKQQAIYQGKVIYHLILNLLTEITGRSDPENISFQDLKKMKYKDLYVIATKTIQTHPQVSTEKKVFSHESTPEVSVASAILASMGAYFYFPGVEIPTEADGLAYTYYDGAFQDNVPSGIFDYQKYIDEIVQPSELIEGPGRKSYSREMFDYENRRKAMKCGIFVKRVHNPHTLTFSIVNTESLLPPKPLPHKNAIETGFALAAGLMSKADPSLSPYHDQIIEIEREVKLTDFGIGDSLQKKLIAKGAEKVAQYFDFPFTEANRKSLYCKIDQIKARAKKYFEFTSNYFFNRIWNVVKAPCQEESNSYRAQL